MKTRFCTRMRTACPKAKPPVIEIEKYKGWRSRKARRALP